MRGYDKILRLVIGLTIGSFISCFSQEQQYKFEHITTKQGLPSANVYSIIKDPEHRAKFKAFLRGCFQDCDTRCI